MIMLNSINNLLQSDTLFWFCALSGSGLVVIQLVLNFCGLDHTEGLEDNGPADALKFKWLSKQALAGFVMMFGWTALACQKELVFSTTQTLITASVVGLLAVCVSGWIFKSARRLHSAGSAFHFEDAIGKEATVYHRIPKGGIGKISLSLNEISYEIDAVSHNNEEIPAFSRVQIIKKADDNILIVTAL